MRGREDWIGPAIKAIEDNSIAKNGEVPNEYKGYIDTFGASIVQNGLIPAVLFFENKGGSGDKEKENIYENRKKLLKAILYVLKEKDDSKSPGTSSTMYEYIKYREGKGEDAKRIRQDIVDAAIAVKLALRTFKFKKNE